MQRRVIPGPLRARVLACVLCLLAHPASARILEVGPGREFALPSVAAQFAVDGDTVEIRAGEYPAEVVSWTQSRLTIRAVGGRVRIPAFGAHAEGKAIWVIGGDEVTVEGIEFSGARVPDRNGAGIRMQGRGLTVRDCVFRDNENGILTHNDPEASLTVENSVFDTNGAGDGRSHNIYVGGLKRFVLTGSYVRGARVGHNVKTRAAENVITYNRIMDERHGTSSYAIDISSGGRALVLGNAIQQGPETRNSHVLSYGAEGLGYPDNTLLFVHNTVVNDRERGGTFVRVAPGTGRALVANNLFGGRGRLLVGDAEQIGNVAIEEPPVQHRMRYDYRPRPGSDVIDRAGDLTGLGGEELVPRFVYRHPANVEPRASDGRPDVGAYEAHR